MGPRGNNACQRQQPLKTSVLGLLILGLAVTQPASADSDRHVFERAWSPRASQPTAKSRVHSTPIPFTTQRHAGRLRWRSPVTANRSDDGRPRKRPAPIDVKQIPLVQPANAKRSPIERVQFLAPALEPPKSHELAPVDSDKQYRNPFRNEDDVRVAQIGPDDENEQSVDPFSDSGSFPSSNPGVGDREFGNDSERGESSLLEQLRQSEPPSFDPSFGDRSDDLTPTFPDPSNRLDTNTTEPFQTESDPFAPEVNQTDEAPRTTLPGSDNFQADDDSQLDFADPQTTNEQPRTTDAVDDPSSNSDFDGRLDSLRPRPLERESDAEFADCKEIYNDRNCCKEEEECRREFAEAAAKRGIRDISLNIVPPYLVPDLTRPLDDLETEKLEKLGQSDFRTWRDQQGNVLAEGQLFDYLNGKVIVTSREGAKSEIPVGRLGRDELCYLNAWWELPHECGYEGEQGADRNWNHITMTWKASSLCHKPLYFEEVQLERYGHSAGPIRQPLLSAAHFCWNIANLPYHIGMNPPTECIYTLGHYRPGSCAPWFVPGVPLHPRGISFKSIATASLIVLIP